MVEIKSRHTVGKSYDIRIFLNRILWVYLEMYKVKLCMFYKILQGFRSLIFDREKSRDPYNGYVPDEIHRAHACKILLDFIVI